MQFGGFVAAAYVSVPPRVFAILTWFCTAELVTISLIVTVALFCWLPQSNALSTNLAVQVVLLSVMVWVCHRPSVLVMVHFVAVQLLNRRTK